MEVSLRGIGFQRTTTTDESGAYAFESLSAGTYELLAGDGKVEDIHADGWNVTRHHIVVPPAPTPRFALVKRRLLDREETDSRHIFFGHVWNARGEPLAGVRIEMSWHEAAPGTLFPTVVTGSNPEQPAGYYEFVNTPGVFQLRVVSEDIESDLATELRTTDVPGRRDEPITYEVDFQSVQEPVIAHLSVIEVNLPGCPESESVQLREAGQRELAPTRRPAPERFLFENLGPGRYEAIGSSLGLIGQVELDGFNPGYVQLPLNGAIEVEISPRAATGRLRLAAEGRGIAREQLVTPGAVVKFEHLPPGAYHLRYLGWHSDPIVLDGLQTVTIRNVDIQLPHESSLEGRVLNADGESLNGQQIVLMAGQEIRGQQITDSRGRYQFAGLPKGEYTLTVEDVGILQPRIELDGQQSIQLDLVAPVEVRPKIIEHYMLLPRQSSPGPWVTLLLLGDYARRLGPAIGFSAKEATLAQRVTIVASLNAIGEDTEQMLLEAGCMVQRLPDESHQLSEALHQALEQ